MKNKNAFTLIELLVVVLIIGILAAIALPQYQKAVRKSRTTEAITTLKALQTAVKAYIYENGEAPSTFPQLNIDIPNAAYRYPDSPEYHYAMTTPNGIEYMLESDTIDASLANMYGYDNPVWLSIWVNPNTTSTAGADIFCKTYSFTPKGKEYCRSMGGKNEVENGSYSFFPL